MSQDYRHMSHLARNPQVFANLHPSQSANLGLDGKEHAILDVERRRTLVE